MQGIDGLDCLPPGWGEGIVALGFFDGLHIGHQEILRRALLLREEHRLPVTLFTFDRHPLEVVVRTTRDGRPTGRGARMVPPKLLTTRQEKIRLVEEFRIDFLLSGTFTPEFSRIPPETFIDDVLCERLRARVVVAGFNYRFGHQHRGDTELLQNAVSRCGFKVVVIPPVYHGDRPVSSTLVRELVAAGKTMEVEPLLGRWYSLTGTVARGEGRGGRIGFPTANLDISPKKLLPKEGVYACVARLSDEFYPGVMNVGKRPTFGEGRVVVEAHLFDFAGELHGRELELFVLDRLRGERKFDGIAPLQEQIAKDVRRARKILLG